MKDKKYIQGKSVLADGRQFRQLNKSDRLEYGKSLMLQGVKELELYLNNSEEGRKLLLRQDVNFM